MMTELSLLGKLTLKGYVIPSSVKPTAP